MTVSRSARLALLSVSDKTGLVEFARQLVDRDGFDLISSGGTAAALLAAGLPVTKVSDYTNSPEILGGRVKTLHPRIHGGILARAGVEADAQDLAAQEIRPIDLVVVNLYPFEQTIARPGVEVAEAIENIDIGGPAMLRAAAKNHERVTVLCRPYRYRDYLNEWGRGGPSAEFRRPRAREAFWHTAAYDSAIAQYFTGLEADPEALPTTVTSLGEQVKALRYGENPHQVAAWYRSGASPSGWAAATQLQGKELSYNNLVDLEAARSLIAEFLGSGQPPAAAILKHTNPCGVALAGGDPPSLAAAYRKALAADPVSAFGGIVALNQAIDPPTAQLLSETFLECVVAPAIDPAAQEVLARKKNLRVLILPDLSAGPAWLTKAIAGGFLLQQADRSPVDPTTWQVASTAAPSPEQLAELAFAWRVVKHVKSNAIVISRDHATLGIGAGQMNRVGSVQIALNQAGDRSKGAVLASDGFFPFDDSIRAAAAAGIAAVIQPGGSLRDAEVIRAANELGLVLVLTGQRHFSH